MLKHRFNIKRLNIFMFITSLFMIIGSIATGFSLWIFNDGIDKNLILPGKVIADDIKENYQVNGGTGDNTNAFKVASDDLKSLYTYKLFGGHGSDTSTNYDYSKVDESRTFTEVNFIEGDGGKNLIYQNYGRLFYIDNMYFGSKDGSSLSNYNVTPKLNGNFDGVSISNFSLNVKQSGYSIARVKSSEDEAYNTDNWLNIIGQKDYFEYKYNNVNANGDSSSKIYKWFQKHVVGDVNDQLDFHYLNFFFDQGSSGTTNADGKDDYLSTFNGNDTLGQEGNYYINNVDDTNGVTKKNWKNTINNAMRRKFFSNNKDLGYYHVLLFVPFERNYVYGSSSQDNIYAFGVSNWENNHQAEEDFAYVALYPASKSINSSIQNFIKIIDYSNITKLDISKGGFTLPTIYNGGYTYDKDGFIDISSNFIDNGNLFIDQLNFNPYSEDENELSYRRVFGVSNSYNTNEYGDPTYNSNYDSDDYHIGGVVSDVFYNYNAEEYTSNDDLATAKKESGLQNIKVTDLNILKSVLGDKSCKLIDHLTLEEVDFRSLYSYDENGYLVDNGEKGIYFNKSMILLLVQDDIDISY